MTHYALTQLPPALQLIWVLRKGTLLAQRWEEDGLVKLYHLPDKGRGFFVEVGYNAYQQKTAVLCSFSASGLLQNYIDEVWLPDV